MSADDARTRAKAAVRAVLDDFAEREANRFLKLHDGLIGRLALSIAKHCEPVSGKRPPPKRDHAGNLAAAVHLMARMNNDEAALAVALLRAVVAPKNTDTGNN